MELICEPLAKNPRNHNTGAASILQSLLILMRAMKSQQKSGPLVFIRKNRDRSGTPDPGYLTERGDEKVELEELDPLLFFEGRSGNQLFRNPS